MDRRCRSGLPGKFCDNPAGEILRRQTTTGRGDIASSDKRLVENVDAGIDTPVYLGASMEVGNVWQSTGDISLSDTLVAGSLFVVVDSILGPLYIAYGGAEGNRRSAYLFLGQTF